MNKVLDVLEGYKNKSLLFSKYNYSNFIFSSILGGLFIGIAAITSQIASFITNNSLIGALIFPLGLFLIVITGVKLFTGNIPMTMIFVNDAKTILDVLVSWIVIWFFNLVGTLIISIPLCTSESINPDIISNIINISIQKLNYTSDYSLFIKAMLCNILVCLGVICAKLGNSIIDKFTAVFLPTTAFVLCGFEHSIADMFYFSVFYYYNKINFSIILYKLFIISIGNIVGGIIITLSLYWSFDKK